MKDYYKIIGVNRNADASTIKNTYLLKLKKYHPDVYNGDKTFAEQKTSELNQAYDVLKDDIKRKEYDLELTKKIKKVNSKEKVEKVKENKTNWFKTSWENIKLLRKKRKEKKLEKKKKKYAKKLKTSTKKLTDEQIELMKDKKKLNFLILVMLIAIVVILVALI